MSRMTSIVIPFNSIKLCYILFTNLDMDSDYDSLGGSPVGPRSPEKSPLPESTYKAVCSTHLKLVHKIPIPKASK